MNYFQELDIPAFNAIQQKLIPYVLENYPGLTQFWNHVDQAQLFDKVPELKHALIELTGQAPLKTYLLIVPNGPDHIINAKLGANSIHQDTSKESARLNWPILNANSIETKLFKSTAEPKKLLLPSGETYLTYQESECEFIDSFCMTKPTVLHVHTIHGLYRATGPLPRYILSFNFDQPIDHLLN